MSLWNTGSSSTSIPPRASGCAPSARPKTRPSSLAGAYHALGDPTRLTLALALRGGRELCVCDLSWIVQRSQNLVSHHMKVLKARGLVRSRKQGKMTMYALTERGAALLAEAAAALRPAP